VTRVLYWNIEKFALNKIANASTAIHHGHVTEAEAAEDRASYIENVIVATQPDIVVVVEVQSPFVAINRLATGSGLDGCFQLLASIREWLEDDNVDPDWMMVPPLQTGPKEAVGVFYNRTNRYFSGPNLWPGGAAGVSARGPIATGAYPQELRACIANRTIPQASLYNGNRAERRAAARTDLTYSAASPNPGTGINWNGLRTPYMVTFYETNPARNLTLFAVHSPAKIFLSRPYLRDELPAVAEMVDGLDPSEARIVVGDFNLNLLTSADQTQSDSYNPIQNTGNYEVLLKPLIAAPDPLDGYEGYFATHIRRKDNAVCWSTQAVDTYYPAYGYFGSDKVDNMYAIDNVFARYGANGQRPANFRFTIMNPLVGSPYNKHPAPDPNTPVGSIGLDRLISQPPPAIAPADGPPYDIGLKARFQSWDNYWYLRSASDHFALAVDV